MECELNLRHTPEVERAVEDPAGNAREDDRRADGDPSGACERRRLRVAARAHQTGGGHRERHEHHKHREPPLAYAARRTSTVDTSTEYTRGRRVISETDDERGEAGAPVT